MTMTNTLARNLRETIGRLGHLAPPDHRNPDRFHEEKSEIQGELTKIADFLEGQFTIVAAKAKAKPEPIKPGNIEVDGRVIRVEQRAPHWFGRPGIKTRSKAARNG